MDQIPPLPEATISRLMGLLEAMRATTGPDDVWRLAGALQLELDDLLPLLQAAELLELAAVEGGDYELTDTGRAIADAAERPRKAIFRERVRPLPLIDLIIKRLEESESGVVPREVIREAIADQFSRKRTERQLDTAVDWGRYAELYDYDAEAQQFVRASTASRGDR